jgi:hypothetical protein
MPAPCPASCARAGPSCSMHVPGRPRLAEHAGPTVLRLEAERRCQTPPPSSAGCRNTHRSQARCCWTPLPRAQMPRSLNPVPFLGAVATKWKPVGHIKASRAHVPSRDHTAAVLHWRLSLRFVPHATPPSSELTTPSLLPHVSPSSYQHVAGPAPFAGATAPAAAAAWRRRTPSPARPPSRPKPQIGCR